MQEFFVSWTYAANYSNRPARYLARTAEEAAERLFESFGPKFRAEATVYVTRELPEAFGRNAPTGFIAID